MLSRRDFAVAASALGLLAAGGGRALSQVAARQQLSQSDLLRFDPVGRLTLLHLTDTHAQLKPIYFREPSVNLGVGEMRGRPPHLTEQAFLDAFKVQADGAEAYALTSKDFAALAKTYGRMGGLDRIATLVRSIRAERGDDNVLLLAGGDEIQGSWTSLQTKGEDVLTCLRALEIDALVGHFEFTYGTDRVNEIAKAGPFAFLAQNIRSVEWQEKVFPSQKIFERGGARVAVIGQAYPRTPIANPRWMIPDWEFGLRETELQQEVDAARANGADVVVLLSHNGYDADHKLAGRVQGLDVILTAHTHDALPVAAQVDKTLLIATGSHGKFLSRLDLDIKDRKVAGYRYRLIPVFSDAIDPDPEMAKLIDEVRAPYEKDLGRVLGAAESVLYRRGNFAGTLDDMICDALLEVRDAEIALSPGFRWGGTLLPGDPITFEAITNACAITYPAVYRNEMTGEQLKATLEDVADNIFNPDPYFQGGGDMVRTGGLGWTIDVSKPIGQRISELTLLRSGAPVEAGKSYTVAGWASVAEGVDGPPIWDVIATHVSSSKSIRIEPKDTIKVVAG